ncbi:hypothetical protein CAPTEDRAFT_224166 [Capitella teleta]|uniref:cardiolipin synthase (CMP-forming) n=1 Tax=Capitella teleta TaxID=283909 RepID=R7T623_CAPTE|nr:hypothetical protein CAPTEDRAFT_224166 [Capitella teleta]|eukprot:ELT88693.1 hypothetical protein CAPTEDRAFT_224166 [Capitella teleta]
MSSKLLFTRPFCTDSQIFPKFSSTQILLAKATAPFTVTLDENIFTIPNMLTSTRIALTPYIGYLVLQQDFNLACSLFVFAGLTDMLDGWIARKFPSQTSALGSFLDPLADKFLVTILYFTLTMAHLIPAPLTFIVIARDVLLVGAASYVRYISLPKPITLTSYFNASRATVELQPMLISKINTALQLSLVAFTLAAPVVGFVDHWALQALWCTTALTTVSSGVGYAIYKNDTFKMIQSAHKKAKTKKS